MAFKTLLIMSLLITAMAFPMAKSQLGLLDLINIQGILYCTPNGNVGQNGTSTPVFPNALVQLQCGMNTVSTTTTNNVGVFSMNVDPLQFLLSSLLSSCSIIVPTPLSTCNVTLPNVGHLLSALKFIGNSILGGLFIANLIPVGFEYLL